MSKKCPKCESKDIHITYYPAPTNNMATCYGCGYADLADRFPEQSVFDRITADEETLAKETVYMDYNYDKQMCGFTTPFIDEMFLIEEQQGKDHEEKYFNAKNKAIAATVARLKEIENERTND